MPEGTPGVYVMLDVSGLEECGTVRVESVWVDYDTWDEDSDDEEDEKILCGCIGSLALEAKVRSCPECYTSKPSLSVYDIATDKSSSVSYHHCKRYITESGSIAELPGQASLFLECPSLRDPEGCCLEREFVLFDTTCVVLYNPETETWTQDSRKDVVLPLSFTHTVENDVLHVFAPNIHMTYTIRGGWREEADPPSTLGTIQQAKSFDRLILLFCESGVHIYDCISGDYARLAETSSRASRFSGTRVGHNTLLSQAEMDCPDMHYNQELHREMMMVDHSNFTPALTALWMCSPSTLTSYTPVQRWGGGGWWSGGVMEWCRDPEY
ncbi:hypothetical protein KIPB_002570 [Kipferlia bialata]|uniref:Uncharacterized protein n=1 Tax=Kipferlia bialata TaxID=797122 RepID=A0A391NPQ7_9EUKA|nr:hypothetical protein KIPB_002570 [Kipferlia bialata]|eukprot:g2570.t1